MRIQLTPQLLKFLILQGYRFCFSKTTNIETKHAEVCITLTPVKYRPVLRHLPQTFDTYFAITSEPAQLAKGIDDTLVFVNLSFKSLAEYLSFVLNTHQKA